MNTAIQHSPSQRIAAFALSVVVTLAMLGGIDAMARHGVSADALLAQQASGVATPL